MLRAKKRGAVQGPICDVCFPARTHQREGERHGHQDREKVDGQRSPVNRLRDRVERRHILESPPTRAQQPAGKHWALGRLDSEKMRFSGPTFGKLQGTKPEPRATCRAPRICHPRNSMHCGAPMIRPRRQRPRRDGGERLSRPCNSPRTRPHRFSINPPPKKDDS